MDNERAQLFEHIVNEVRDERQHQLEKWGDEFDSKNTPNDWVAYIACYLGKAVTLPWSPLAFRTALIKVATLCFAAVEWLDRTEGNMPKRHYD